MKQKLLVKIITGETDFWQPFGKKDSCHIIEEAEPFFWRINPEWAKDVSVQILSLLQSEIKECVGEEEKDDWYVAKEGRQINLSSARNQKRQEIINLLKKHNLWN